MKIIVLFAIVLISCHDDVSTSDTNDVKQQETSIMDTARARVIKPSDLKIGPSFSTSVVSDGQKFILPVPSFKADGEPLVYPSGHEKAGQPILDHEGHKIGDKGIVFFNYKDSSCQAAAGDGEAVIIINEVDEQQAAKLHKKVMSLQTDVSKLTLKELKEIIAFAKDELALTDMYNSTRSYIKNKMSAFGDVPGTQKQREDLAYGLKKRNSNDINQAVYIAGAFVFEGPAASPQKFNDGGVIVESKGKMRGVQPNIFVRTYKLANGNPIRDASKDIKRQL